MKSIVTSFFVLMFCISISAQDGFPEYYKICGDPQNESILTSKFNGKVVKIIDGDTVIIKLNDKNQTVNLATVDASLSETKAKKFLSKKLLGKKVFFFVYGSQNDADEIFADIFYEDVYSASRSLITKGIARFKKADNYAFSTYKSCVYQRLEEIAKEEKLGIWAK